MRNNYGADWAFGLRGAIENIVRASFSRDLRLWPLLQAFDFESYVVGGSHCVIVLRDKLSGIPSGFDLKPFPHTNHPSLPVTSINVGAWQSYLGSTFALRPEDAAVVLPIYDSGKSNALEDYKLFSEEDKAVWDYQVRLIVARQKTSVHPTSSTSPNPPTHITYNVYGTNSRVNINSVDSSSNVVQQHVPEVFDQLLSAIRSANIDRVASKKIEKSVVKMQESFGTSNFAERYRSFMSLLADHIQVFSPIVAPFLPALAELVT